MKLILCFFLLAFSSLGLSDAYDITDTSLKVNRSDNSKMTLTFTFNDIPTTDLKAYGSNYSDSVRLILVQDLDICVDDESCDEYFPFSGYANSTDNTDETKLSDDYSLSFLSTASTKDDTLDEYDFVVSISISVNSGTVSDEGDPILFIPNGTRLYVKYEANAANEDFSLLAGISTPVKTEVSNALVRSQNLSLVVAWDKPDSVTYLDDSVGTYTGVRVYMHEVSDSLSTAPSIVRFFDTESDGSLSDGSDETVLDDCTLFTDIDSDPENPICEFSCASRGYLDPNLAEDEGYSLANNETAVTFDDLDITKYYVLIPQMLDGGLLTEQDDGSYGASCLVGQPRENYTYAQLSGAGASKAGDPNCFIATAAYGSPLAPELKHLRWFRDQYLMTHSWGRAMVSWYYAHSPDWAKKLVFQDTLRAAVRAMLWVPVSLIKALRFYPSISLTALTLLCLSGFGFVLARRFKES